MVMDPKGLFPNKSPPFGDWLVGADFVFSVGSFDFSLSVDSVGGL